MNVAIILRVVEAVCTIGGLVAECLASSVEHDEIVNEAAGKAASQVAHHIKQHQNRKDRRR